MQGQQPNPSDLNFYGKVVISGHLVARTGLHIGGSQGGMDIGGVDKIVIRDRLTNQPYVPGSSLKGKMRALVERARGKTTLANMVQVVAGGPTREPIRIHMCNDPACEVCLVFGRNNVLQGIPRAEGNERLKIDQSTPTRLIVRDSRLTKNSVGELGNRDLDQLYTEVKWEVGIDRITSAANPRQMERVLAGARFRFNIAYSVLTRADADNFIVVLEGLRLLEDDYLGGLGSRGSGQVAFTNLRLNWRSRKFYEGVVVEDDIVEAQKLWLPADTNLKRKLPRLSDLTSERLSKVVAYINDQIKAEHP